MTFKGETPEAKAARLEALKAAILAGEKPFIMEATSCFDHNSMGDLVTLGWATKHYISARDGNGQWDVTGWWWSYHGPAPIMTSLYGEIAPGGIVGRPDD